MVVADVCFSIEFLGDIFDAVFQYHFTGRKGVPLFQCFLMVAFDGGFQ